MVLGMLVAVLVQVAEYADDHDDHAEVQEAVG